MTIAEQKKQENIAEYLLYVWQMEELVRLSNFEIARIDAYLGALEKNEKQFQAERKWFETLIGKMRSEKTVSAGHLAEFNEILGELFYLHQTLLTVLKDPDYISRYEAAKPNIAAYLQKANNSTTNDVETCLVGLYGLLMLRLSKTEISEETQKAMKSFSEMVAFLAQKYGEMKSGTMNFNLN